MLLVFSLFMGSYSALAFKVDYLNGKIVDDHEGRKKAFENSDKFKGAIDRFNSTEIETDKLDKN